MYLTSFKNMYLNNLCIILKVQNSMRHKYSNLHLKFRILCSIINFIIISKWIKNVLLFYMSYKHQIKEIMKLYISHINSKLIDNLLYPSGWIFCPLLRFYFWDYWTLQPLTTSPTTNST